MGPCEIPAPKMLHHTLGLYSTAVFTPLTRLTGLWWSRQEATRPTNTRDLTVNAPIMRVTGSGHLLIRNSDGRQGDDDDGLFGVNREQAFALLVRAPPKLKDFNRAPPLLLAQHVAQDDDVVGQGRTEPGTAGPRLLLRLAEK